MGCRLSGGQSSGTPFTAKDKDDYGSRFTSKPEVTNHPTGGGWSFRNRKYFDSATARRNAKIVLRYLDDFNATNAVPVSGGRNDLLKLGDHP